MQNTASGVGADTPFAEGVSGSSLPKHGSDTHKANTRLKNGSDTEGSHTRLPHQALTHTAPTHLPMPATIGYLPMSATST